MALGYLKSQSFIHQVLGSLLFGREEGVSRKAVVESQSFIHQVLGSHVYLMLLTEITAMGRNPLFIKSEI